MKYLEDKDLNFLKEIESTELNKLVEILTKTKSEELTKKDIYKEFEPDHKLYWKEIASELQYFGGNTIANVFRQKGVLYAEILSDVCKSLGLEVDTSLCTQKIEKKLLNYEKKDGIFEKIKSSINKTDLKDTGVLVASRFTPFALPVIPILVVKKLSDPAYRITTEAVFEIANLRKKYNSKAKDIVVKNKKSSKPPINYTDSLIVKDKNNDSDIIELKVLGDKDIEELDFNLFNDEENSMKHLISDITKGIISTSNQTVELVFSPDVQKGLANGTYKLLDNKAIVVSSTNGKIKEHAKIVQSGQTKQFLTGGYQLLSVVVAQSHLADIEKRLYSIETSLKHILEKLEAEDVSRIQGSIDYIKNIFDSFKTNIEKNKLSQAQKNQIEQITKDVLHWKNKLILEFDNLIKDVKSIKDRDTFGTENSFIDLKNIYNNRLISIIIKYDLLIELNLLLTTLINFTDPLKEELTGTNFNNEEFKYRFSQLIKNINEKQELVLKSYFNLNDTINERKKVLSILKNKSEEKFNYLNINYKNTMKKIENKFNNTFDDKVSVILSLDENSEIKQYTINTLH